MPAVCLRGDPRKHQEGRGEVGQGKKAAGQGDVDQASCDHGNGASLHRDLSDPQGRPRASELSSPSTPKYYPTLVLPAAIG